jgi:hypothetical protein
MIPMGQRARSVGKVLLHGSYGALLAGLAAIGVQLLWPSIHWLAVGLSAVFGFALAALVGEKAIELLKELLGRS